MLMTLTSNLHWACVYIKKHVTLWTNFCDFIFHDSQLLSFLALSCFVVMHDEYFLFVSSTYAFLCFQFVVIMHAVCFTCIIACTL